MELLFKKEGIFALARQKISNGDCSDIIELYNKVINVLNCLIKLKKNKINDPDYVSNFLSIFSVLVNEDDYRKYIKRVYKMDWPKGKIISVPFRSIKCKNQAGELLGGKFLVEDEYSLPISERGIKQMINKGVLVPIIGSRVPYEYLDLLEKELSILENNEGNDIEDIKREIEAIKIVNDMQYLAKNFPMVIDSRNFSKLSNEGMLEFIEFLKEFDMESILENLLGNDGELLVNLVELMEKRIGLIYDEFRKIDGDISILKAACKSVESSERGQINHQIGLKCKEKSKLKKECNQLILNANALRKYITSKEKQYAIGE